jgi:hypothetical protein
MARTIRTKVYKFNELNEDAKQKAIDTFYDINVMFEWWDQEYEDAEQIGCKIKGFDIDRGSYCDLEFTESAPQVADMILENHGETCETYKTAKQFLADRDALVEKYSDGINKNQVAEDNEYEFDNECDQLEEEFRKSLSEDYLIMLRHDYEYQTSKEAIVESIIANEYEFTKDGKLFNR